MDVCGDAVWEGDWLFNHQSHEPALTIRLDGYVWREEQAGRMLTFSAREVSIRAYSNQDPNDDQPGCLGETIHADSLNLWRVFTRFLVCTTLEVAGGNCGGGKPIDLCPTRAINTLAFSFFPRLYPRTGNKHLHQFAVGPSAA